MALTRSHMRQLSFLLEVAPLSSHSRHQSSHARNPTQCLLRKPPRRHQSGRAFQRASEQQPSRPQSNDSSAQNRLMRDLRKKEASDKKLREASLPGTTPTNTTNKTTNGAGNGAGNGAVERLRQALEDAQLPLKRERVVSEKETLDSLRICFDLARLFSETGAGEETLTPVMEHLFELDETATDAEKARSAREQAIAIRDRAIDAIAAAGHNLVVDPKVYITDKVLELYVVFKGYLGRPDDLATVFDLYANKPVPEPDSSPVTFKPATPDQAASAIPFEVAEAALDAAIEARNLALCLDVIDKSVCTESFKRRKFVSQALVPTVGLAAAPFAAYAIASQFAVFQEHMTTSTAKWVGFAGITSYLAFTGTIGFVALTTANDQMHRVTWADGMPLRQRWMREPERALLDKLVMAWGFKNKHRWGEEEGPEWTALKELVAMRRMVLDRIELMEGMN